MERKVYERACTWCGTKIRTQYQFRERCMDCLLKESYDLPEGHVDRTELVYLWKQPNHQYGRIDVSVKQHDDGHWQMQYSHLNGGSPLWGEYETMEDAVEAGLTRIERYLDNNGRPYGCSDAHWNAAKKHFQEFKQSRNQLTLF